MRSMVKFCTLMLATFIFIGCATTYGPKGTKGGYSEKQITENTFEVTFEGNEHNSADQIRNYLMYRCAELTLEQGLSHFLIVEDASYQEVPESEFVENDLVIETHTSMSGGTNNSVRSNFGAQESLTNTVGIFVIMMRQGPDPVHGAASIDAKVLIDSSEHLIKK